MAVIVKREQLADLVQHMPDHLTVGEAIERLQFWAAIQEAEDDLRAGRTMTHAAVLKDIKTWPR